MGQHQGKSPKDEVETSDDAAENLVESDSEEDKHGGLDVTDGTDQTVKVSMCIDPGDDDGHVSQEEHVLEEDKADGSSQDEAAKDASGLSDTAAQCDSSSDRKKAKESLKMKHRQIKSFAADESSASLLPEKQVLANNLQEALDQAAVSVKEQNFFSETLEAETETKRPSRRDAGDSQTRVKAKRSQSRMRRFFKRKSVMKVVPEDKLEGHASVLDLRAYNNPVTPTGIFDIAVIAPPPEFEDAGDDLTMTENRDLYQWLVEEEFVPSPISEWPLPKPEAEHITPTQLYNSMNDGQKSCYLFDPTFLLVIDVRMKEDYAKNHINTAHHVSELQQNPSAFEPMDEYTVVVVYDDFGMSYSLTDSQLSIAMDQLIARKADAFVLEGGFRAFHSKHPYLCSNKVPATEAERQQLVPNYPSIIIEDQLYLGRVDQACQESTVKNLKITHVVCIVPGTSLPFPDFISYHHMKLADEPNICLHDSFPDAIQFITDAIEMGGRVIVHCNLGQSRSATVVIAYLMFTRKWTLDDAYNFVREQRPVIHPNEGFMSQLSNFEKALFGKRITKIESYGYKLVCLKQKVVENIAAAEPKEQKVSKKQKYKMKKAKNKEKESETQQTMLDYEKLGNESDSGEFEDPAKEEVNKVVPGGVELDTSLQADAIPTLDQNTTTRPVSRSPVVDGRHLLDATDLAEDGESGGRSRSSSRGSSSPRYTRMSEEAGPQQKKTKKAGGLMKILVGTTATGSNEKDSRTKANMAETASEGDDISLIGDLNEEISDCLNHGISNVAHGGDRSNPGQGQVQDGLVTVSHGAVAEEVSRL